jgi:hypothetical protein
MTPKAPRTTLKEGVGRRERSIWQDVRMLNAPGTPVRGGVKEAAIIGRELKMLLKAPKEMYAAEGAGNGRWKARRAPLAVPRHCRQGAEGAAEGAEGDVRR